MKTKLTLLTALASLGAFVGANAQTAVTPAAGYHTETAQQGFTAIGVNIGNAVSAAGDFDADTTQDNDVDFTTLLTAGNPYEVQNIDTGDVATIISVATATTLETDTTPWDPATVTPLAVTTGDKYEIRESLTVAGVFGAANEAGIAPGPGDGVTGDRLWIPDGLGGWTQVYYTDVDIPIFGGTIPIGWHEVGSNDDAADFVIPFNYGVFFQRLDATDLSFVFTGHVRGDDDADGHGATMTNTAVVSGFNIVNRIVPVDITLADSGIENYLTPGTSAVADVLWLYDTAGLRQVYYTDVAIPIFGGSVGPGLLEVGSNADASGFMMPSAAVVQRKNPTDGSVTIVVPPALDL